MSDKSYIIFDTDMDTDCDDVGAFAMLLEAHLAKRIKLIGVIADSVSKHAAPCCEAIAERYNVNIPIGAIYSDDYMDTDMNIARFAEYRNHSQRCLDGGNSYNRIFAEEIGKSDRDYPDAVSVYRKLLAQAEDHSVTVLCVGMLTAIAEAISSGADQISPLSGEELFSRKVKHVITMGDPDVINDFNWGNDSYAAERFFSLCPVPIYISSEGSTVITGERFSAELPSDHPLRRAYEIWLGRERRGRCSWDQIATLYAIEPQSRYLSCKDHGACAYDADKKQLRKEERDMGCKRIHINCEIETIEKVLNQYMLGDYIGI